jgi:hypothetical protein
MNEQIPLEQPEIVTCEVDALNMKTVFAGFPSISG